MYLSDKITTCGTKCDVRVHSLEITNFSLYPGEFEFFGNYLSVDIIDYLFTVDTIRSTFTLNGYPINTSFSGINNGVRAYCDIDNNFMSNDTIDLGFTAYNIINDVMYAHYYLLFGYNVEAINNFKFDYDKEVFVKVCGVNNVECPNRSCGAFTFKTVDYPSYNLQASLSCVVNRDLQAEIYPQSTAFMYGKTYKLIISGIKDYSGNYMPTSEIIFRIEESP